MKSGANPLSSIERALEQLDQILGAAHTRRQEIPTYGPTLLASMNEKDQAMAQRAEEARHEADPEQSAIHFCLTSAIALLEVSQVLLNPAGAAAPQERERQCKTLVAYTKTAGRSAYRAASILTDQKDC